MAYSTFVLTSIKDRFNTNATFFTRLTVFYMNAWYIVDLMEETLRYLVRYSKPIQSFNFIYLFTDPEYFLFP